MKLILTFAYFYLAFLLHAALQNSPAGEWAPNLTLIAGLAAAHERGGIAWATLAGLLCDCLYDRPLGTTMLVATLVVAVGRQWRVDHSSIAEPTIPARFLIILTIELLARLLTAFAADNVSPLQASFASLTIAATSTATSAVILISTHVINAVFQTHHDTLSSERRVHSTIASDLR